MNKVIGDKLREARKSIGLTQVQAAGEVSISRSKLIGIENGDIPVDIVLLGKLAHLYGYSLEYFINEDASEKEIEINFAFRAADFNEADALITSWAKRVFKNIRDLEYVCEEAGI